MANDLRIHIARVYDTSAVTTGARVLVDRLWPRGMRKSDLVLDDWMKDVAPSNELRKWFNHDPVKWTEFKVRYVAELAANPAAVERLATLCRNGPVTLLYSARDQDHNQAVVLRDYLVERLQP